MPETATRRWRRCEAFEPHVVTLDIHMPEMDGLTCLDRIMLEHPCPVVMVSSLTDDGADVTLQALDARRRRLRAEAWRRDFAAMDTFGPLLIDKVRMAAAGASAAQATGWPNGAAAPRRAWTRAAERRPDRAPGPASRTPRPSARASAWASWWWAPPPGGPPALDALLQALPADFPAPILVAQHMPASFTGPLARRLDRLCALTSSEVTRPVGWSPGTVYVGRGDADLIVSAAAGRPDGAQRAGDPRSIAGTPASIGSSTARCSMSPPERVIGILMTGMGDDGAAAMTALRKGGGRTIAEAEETAVVWGMPGELVRAGGASCSRFPSTRSPDRLLDLVAAGDERPHRRRRSQALSAPLISIGSAGSSTSSPACSSTSPSATTSTGASRIACAANGLTSFASYFSQLRQDPGEAEQLINSFTVNETYFYREEHQFSCLSENILPEIVKRPGARRQDPHLVSSLLDRRGSLFDRDLAAGELATGGRLQCRDHRLGHRYASPRRGRCRLLRGASPVPLAGCAAGGLFRAEG